MKEKNMKKAVLTLCLLAVCWIPVSAESLPGDVDASGKIDISDVTVLIDYLLSKDTSLVDVEAADVDGDGVVTIADVTELVDMILMASSAPEEDEHEWVDLGLPSGTLWATCNIGADTPEGYGDYFAWGETEPKETYSWSNYKWCNNVNSMLTKYCTDSSYGDNGFVDNKTELDVEDDAAYVNWGENWRIPSADQANELIENCSWSRTTRNGVKGKLVTGPNGASLFLPAAGYHGNSLINVGQSGYYCLNFLAVYNSRYGGYLSFYYKGDYFLSSEFRSHGSTVRAVRVPQN